MKQKTENNYDNQTEEFIEEWNWEKAQPAGNPVSRTIAHKEGIAHEGVHLWILRLSDQPELLFQHRANHKENYPDCLDITVGGHVPFGKNDNKIQKESYEEIGISPSGEELIDLGYYRYEEKVGEFNHREFQHVFLYINNGSLDQYKFVDGEVDGIFAVKVTDLKKLMIRDFSFIIEGYEQTKSKNKLVSRKDFHPLLFTQPMEKYMQVIFQAIDQIAENNTISAKMPSPFLK